MITRDSIVPGHQVITKLHYNAYGQVLKMTEQGWSPSTASRLVPLAITRTTTYRYGQLNGRSVLTDIDGPLPNGPIGSPSDSDVTRFTWDKAGNSIVAVTGPGDRTVKLAYDAAGRIAATTDSTGE